MSYEKSADVGIDSHLYNGSYLEKDLDEHHAPYKFMFLFLILFIGCLFKTVFASLRVPYTGLIICIGLIGGILFNIFSKDNTFLSITISSPDLLAGIFLPALIFESAYRVEYHAFMKSFYSILLFSIIGYFTSLFSISIINKYLFFFQQWTFFQCLILGVILSATKPITLMRQTDYGKTKRFITILEDEAVINNSLAIVLFNALKIVVVNENTWCTIHFFKTTAISLIGGIVFGTIAGILEIIGLPYFYDDPISEVTITTAIPYMLYWLCEQVYSSGIIAIVVLGLILSNHKTAISSEAAIFMEKFWDMLTLVGNTIVYLLTALAIVEFNKSILEISSKDNTILLDIGLAIINYFICYIVRFFMIILLTRYTKLCRNCHLSWQECLLATWGEFKGSICLILCLALAGEFQLADKQLTRHVSSKFKNQILIYISIIVFLSSCMNSTYSLLLKLLNFTKISEIKYHYMTQCVDSLRALVKEKIESLQKNKYLANADWIFIERNFQLENPHALNMINNGNRNRNSIDSNVQHSYCHRSIPLELNQTQYDDLFEEARIRIINIQKTSFWRQYRDYEISTQTVRILSSLSDFAIDRNGQYISIDQLKYYYKPRTVDFIWKYLKSSAEKLHTCIRNDWRKYQMIPRNKWRLFYFNILNHKQFNVFMIFVIVFNVTLAIIRSVVITSNQVNLALTSIQNISNIIYLLEFIIKIYTFDSRIYFRTWIYYRIECILLILVIIESILEYYHFIFSKSINRRVWSVMQIIVIIQILRIIRTTDYILANLNIIFERIANRYVTLSLELCTAYVVSEDDVLSKLPRIIEIDQIRDHFHKDSIRRREQLINELTCIQTEHPNVSASVKTRAAIQKLLNYSKNIVHHMAHKGLLGENESDRITQNINHKLHTELVPPIVFFPIPFNFLHVFPWLHDPDVLEYVLSRLHIKSFSLNEYIYKLDNDSQALFFITAGYVETIRNMPKFYDALSMENFHKNKENNSYDTSQSKKDSYSFDPKSDLIDSTSQYETESHVRQQYHADLQKVDIIDKKVLLKEDLFQSSDDHSEQKQIFFNTKNNLLNFNESILSQLNMNDSIFDFFSTKQSTKVHRLLHAPGDIIGHIDLLNGQKYTETCKCITNTLVWYLKANDLIVLIERFNHLRILEKIWHYTSLQLAEIVLYEYLNAVPYNLNEQERNHIYGHLKHAFLIPESYLIEQKVIYSSHELILIQGQLQNIVSSLIYTGPCFIQIEIGKSGLKPLNINETKILALRNTHYHHTLYDEFVLQQDLPGLIAHVIYDEKLCIYLPRIGAKYEHIRKPSNSEEPSAEIIKKTLLGRFLENLPKFQRRIINT
ncbi:unnamed protein product [Rotaria socialis]|uniref:Cation/H+ exchanger transmembrane domain-containing protein n=2 Tax=Rotaria socialis TaxID=392032 RepID=A0A817Y999_9BILA|nr:unnamed protein product [Rotaria socialis]